MLKSVELRNFKSFHNKVKIDFEKTNYKTLLNTNVKGIRKSYPKRRTKNSLSV